MIFPRCLLTLLLACLAACGRGTPELEQPNLLLIAVDTLRADRLGAYGYERPTSPEIDQLLKSSVVFEDAHSASSWTLPAFASLFTSLYPSTHGCWQFDNFLSPTFTTLPERLQAAGYLTAGIVSHIFLGRKYGLGQGFSEYDDSLVQPDFKNSHMQISSPTITDRALKFLNREAGRAERRPWFLFLHYFDPHIFYQVHEGISESFGVERNRDRYDGEIRFTDQHIGRLLDRMEELRFFQQTIVVFVADHGEEFREHGGVMHGRTLYTEIERIPLAIRVPGERPGRIRAPVRGVDLLPTLLDLLELPRGDQPMVGHSLVELVKGASPPDAGILMESRLDQLPNATLEAYILGKWKLIVKTPRREDQGRPVSVSLFDRKLDPAEQNNVAEEHPEIVSRMAERLRTAVSNAERAATLFQEGGRLNLSEEELERLRELGYLK